MNGCNFIDGCNGLMTSFNFIFFICIYNFSLDVHDINIQNLCIIFLICHICFFIFNFPLGKIFIGDFGAYMSGLIIASIILYLSNVYDFVKIKYFYPVIFYQIFEVIFSVIRKILSNKSPFKPDRKHLHLMIFSFLNKSLNNHLLANNLTTLIILVFLGLPNLLIFNYQLGYLGLFILMIIYLTIYYIFHYLLKAEVNDD